jgi:hypothetical protein
MAERLRVALGRNRPETALTTTGSDERHIDEIE